MKSNYFINDRQSHAQNYFINILNVNTAGGQTPTSYEVLLPALPDTYEWEGLYVSIFCAPSVVNPTITGDTLVNVNVQEVRNCSAANGVGNSIVLSTSALPLQFYQATVTNVYYDFGSMLNNIHITLTNQNGVAPSFTNNAGDTLILSLVLRAVLRMSHNHVYE